MENRFPTMDDVIDDIRDLVGRAQRIGTLAHRDADADSLGSALGFAASLRELGKDVVTVVPSPRPQMLDHLPGIDAVRDEPGEIDALFTFDCATLDRFGDQKQLVERTAQVVNVDHHVSNEGFGSIVLVDPTASATGEVVYHLLRALKAPIDADVATNLYAALFTDTGGFRHDNTTEAALRLGAELVRHGADPAYIAMRSYKWRSVGQVRLEGLAIARMRAELDGRLIWTEITDEMLAESGAGMQEAEGVIDQLQGIASMQIAVVFKASGDTTKISVRTRDRFDATSLCIPFGGGGHRRAAGAELRMPLDDARAQVLAIARTQLEAAS
jgi:phosphoesterase RecJ-like protein